MLVGSRAQDTVVTFQEQEGYQISSRDVLYDARYVAFRRYTGGLTVPCRLLFDDEVFSGAKFDESPQGRCSTPASAFG